MRRRRDEQLYNAPDQEDELSLESILAEYGRGGRQPAPEQEPPQEPSRSQFPLRHRNPFRNRSLPRNRFLSRNRSTNPPRRIAWR